MKFQKVKVVIINAFGLKGAVCCLDQDGNQIPELSFEKDIEGFFMDRIKTYWADIDTEYIDQINYRPKFKR